MTDELNPDQEKAAKFKDGVCAVIAVPGSAGRLAQ
jgi:superfamily I DNA/RNA helicase